VIRRAATLAGLLLLPALIAGQDSARVDTSLAPVRDTLNAPIRVTLPLEGPAGPLPAGSRWVFTRDSLFWTSAYSVADLLAEVPGVFNGRSGFVQSTSAVGVGGRGTDGIELHWDGVPWQPVGPDSTGPDLSAISLLTLRRVDVHQLPGLLRVFLISERHDGPGSRSVVRVVSGAQRAGGYAGLFQQAWDGGLRLGLAADGLRTNRPDGDPNTDRRFDVWGRFDWSPSQTVTASWQIRRSELERGPQAAPPLAVGARAGTRTDGLLSMRVSSRPEGAGWSAGAALRSSGFSDSVFGDRVMREVLVDAGHRGARDEVRVRAGVGDGAVRRRADLEAGVVPVGPIVLHAGARWTRDGFARDSWRSWGTVGLVLGPIGLSGDAVRTRAFSLPLVATDTVQRATDLAVRLAFTSRVLAGRVGVERRGAWSPSPVSVLGELPLATTGAADWIVTWVRLGPFRSFTASGWYADARGTNSPDLQPPTHGRFQLTYRSKFWRTFHSGAFDLKVQWATESWSGGTVGRLAGGSPIALPGATFQEWFVQFEIVGFRAFYLLRNARNSPAGYLPGFPQPRNAQTFGVKWEFSS